MGNWGNETQQPNNFLHLSIVANKPTAHLVRRHVCMLAPAAYRWMTSSQLKPRIRVEILGRNWMMMLRHSSQFQESSQQRKQALKSSNWSFNGRLSFRSDTLMPSETVRFVSLPITRNEWLMTTMWLGYASTITLEILLLQALWRMGSIQVAAQLLISHCEEEMHWLDSCSRICVVGGYISGTLESGWMGDNLVLFGEVLGLF